MVYSQMDKLNQHFDNLILLLIEFIFLELSLELWGLFFNIRETDDEKVFSYQILKRLT